MQFDNRTIVITGGTGALGTAVVGALLADGALSHPDSGAGRKEATQAPVL